MNIDITINYNIWSYRLGQNLISKIDLYQKNIWTAGVLILLLKVLAKFF